MMPPRVSILVPAHNAAPWLAQTLDSALAQSWPHCEVIVAENGSTDATLELARRYESRGVRVLALPAMTAAAARNRAWAVSTGDFIQYLDADDLLSPDKIAAQLADLQGQPGSISLSALGEFRDGESLATARVFRAWPIYSTGEPAHWLADLLGAFGRSGYVAVHQWLTPRALIEQVGPWEETLTVQDDGEFFSRVVLAARGLRATLAPVAYYRRHAGPTSLSAAYRTDRRHATSMLRALDLIASRAHAACADPRLDAALARQYYSCAVLTYPHAPEISRAAERAALALDPAVRPPVATSRMAAWVRALTGWRTERRIAQLARRWHARTP